MGTVLGRLMSPTFDKKRMTPHSEFSPGTVIYIYITSSKNAG